jgi:hypothetical protein
MSTLTDRYVHATLRALPENRRGDLGEELRGTITDMVDARVDAGQSPGVAERDAVLELGDPALLAARYSGARLHLIGPELFLVWKRLLIQLLMWVPALIAAITVGVDVLDGGKEVGEVIVSAGGAAVTTAIQIAFWLTLLFAILDRVGTGITMPCWTPDQLPDEPIEREYPLSEAAAAIAFNVIIGGLLVLQHFRSWVTGPGGDDLPLLHPDLWGSWLPVLLALILVSIGLELWKHRSGWSLGAGATTVVTSVAFAVPIAWLATQERLLNPAFLDAVELGQTGRENLATAIAAGAVLVALWEIGEAVVKGVTRRQPHADSDARTRVR